MNIYRYKAKRLIGPFWVLIFSPGMTYLFENHFSISGFYRTLFYSVLLILFLGAIRQLFLLNKEIALSREFIEVRKYFFEKQRIPISNIDDIVTDSMSEGRYVLGVKLLGSEFLKVSYIDLEYLKEPEEFISELTDMINP